MARQASLSTSDFVQQMARAYAINDRMNQLLLEHLDTRAWRAKPPGKGTRNIAEIFAHVHNVRRKWLRLSAPHLKLPAQLERSRVTQKQASKALADSAARCCEMLVEALSARTDRAPAFLRDGWARPWQPGVAILAYMVCHDAHHRGQVCMTARQLGYPLPGKVTSAMWSWERLWKECGFDGLVAGTKP